MFRAYKFRIYPTPAQEAALRKTIGCCRYVYNWGLALRREAWVQNAESKSGIDSINEMTRLKDAEETAWLREVSSVALQQSLRNLDTAFSRFFKRQSRYPKFKKKRFGGSARFMENGFTFKGGVLKLGRVKGAMDVRWSRELPSQPSSVTVSLDPSGRWHASFLCETEVEKLPPAQGRVGVDLGVSTFATTSDGRKFPMPEKVRASRAKIDNLNRSLSRKKKGSKNRDKARWKLALAHARAKDARRDFLHKLSTKLVRENQAVCIEDLAVMDMQKLELARSIGEQGWREFRTLLEYKCEWYGRELVAIDRFYPSSKTCSKCGGETKLRLDQRSWRCRCGARHDRDVNAAKNILAAGLAVTACGADVRP